MAGGSYTEGSVFRHISGLSITSAIGLFAIFIVDLVDVFFISILGEPELAAAVGFAGVGLFFGAAICIGLAISVSTVVAQAIGAAGKVSCGDSRRLASHGLLVSLCLTFPLTVWSLVYARELLALTGAEGHTLDLAVEYFRIVGASLPILGLAMTGTSLLRAVGDGTLSMWSTIIAGIVNAVLDPLFIFALSMGLSGAALASVLSRMTVAGIAIGLIMRKHQLIGWPVWSKLWADLRSLSSIAVPSLITNLSTPLGSAWVTSRLAVHGVDAVAAAAVIGRLTPVAFAGLYGLSSAVGPVASQNFGANDMQRVRATLIASGQFVVMYVVPVAVLFFFSADLIVAIFDLNEEAGELLRFYCHWVIGSYVIFGLQLAANPLFTAIRHPGYATISNVGRDLLLGLPLIGIGGLWFGAPGVLGGQALGNALAGIIAFSVALWMTHRLEDGRSIGIHDALRTRWHFHRQMVPGIQQRGH